LTKESKKGYAELWERGTKMLRRTCPRLPGVVIGKFVKEIENVTSKYQNQKANTTTQVTPTWNLHESHTNNKKRNGKSIYLDNKSKVEINQKDDT